MERLFFELFEPLPRQGPGSAACTRRAFDLCAGLPDAPRILDLGCGSGAQTVDLARRSGGTVLAIDSHAPLVERARARAQEAGLSDRVEVRVADMTDLGLPPHGFDLVWSEGALYNLGLRVALPLCAEQLRPGGYLAFTDAVWRTDDPPADVRAAFAAEYDTMGHAHDVLRLLEALGWTVVDHFDLPDAAWWDDFYTPMEARIAELRTMHVNDPEALATLDALAKEPQMHRESARHYGYTFFIARLP